MLPDLKLHKILKEIHLNHVYHRCSKSCQLQKWKKYLQNFKVMLYSHYSPCLHVVCIPDASIPFLSIEEASCVKPWASQHLAAQGENTGFLHGKQHWKHYRKENPSVVAQKWKIEIETTAAMWHCTAMLIRRCVSTQWETRNIYISSIGAKLPSALPQG